MAVHRGSQKSKRYEAVAEDIQGQIERGVIAAGQRIPSVRELSRLRNVSVTTVLEAYRRLEGTGWIEARPQSGFYARATPHTRCAEPERSTPGVQAQTVTRSGLIGRILRDASQPGMIPLGAAMADPSLLPVGALARLQARIARQHPESQSYDFPPGYAQLRQQIARRIGLAGCSVPPDDVLITCGCTEAIRISLDTVTRPGDIVAIESPSYYGFLEQLEHLGLQAVEVPTEPGEGMCLDALEAIAETQPINAVLLCSNFSNPLGAQMPDEKKRAFAKFAAERRIPILEDDIYGELPHGPARPSCIKTYDVDDWVLHCGSFSKTLAPGMRVGWVAGARFRDELLARKRSSSWCNAKLPLMVVAEFLGEGGYDHHLRRMRRKLQDNFHRIAHVIYEAFPDGTRVTRPRGGYVLWIECAREVDTAALSVKAASHNISVIPGSLFSTTDHYTHCMRLNLGVAWDARVESALRMLGSWVHEQLSGRT